MRALTDIFVYGESGADNIIQVPYLPTPDRAACILSEAYFTGGVGANVAVVLANWGVNVRLSGNALGDDEYGLLARRGLERHPTLDLAYLETRPGLRTPFWRIMVTPDGERSQLYGFGELSATPLRRDMLGGARLLALDLYGGEERNQAARMAHKAGLTLVVGDITDPNHPLLPITHVAVNSASLTRGEYPGMDPFEHARRLQHISGGIVLTTDGGNPALAIDRDGSEFWASPPQVKVLDATGAGDAFKAGVMYGLWKGWKLQQAVAWGMAAGSLNTRTAGATSFPPTITEVNETLPRVQISTSRPG